MADSVIQISPRIEQTSKEESKYDRLERKYFENLLLLLRVFGLGIYKGSNKEKWMFGRPHMQIYSMVIALLLIADAGRFITVFNSDMVFNGSLMTKLSFESLFLWSAYTHVVVGNYNSWPSIVKHYLRYCERYKICTENIKWQRIIVIAVFSTITSLCCCLGIYFLPVFVDIPEHVIVGRLHTPFNSAPVHVKAGISAILGVIRFYGLMATMFIFMCFHITCTVLSEKYSMINTELEEMFSERDDDMTHFEQLRRQHEKLTLVLVDANKFLGQVAFAVYALSIPLVCFILYGLIMGNLPLLDLLSLLYFLIQVVGAMIMVTHEGIRLNDEVSATSVFFGTL